MTKSDGGKFESKVEVSKEHDPLPERKSWFGCADKMIWGKGEDINQWKVSLVIKKHFLTRFIRIWNKRNSGSPIAGHLTLDQKMYSREQSSLAGRNWDELIGLSHI